jgi:hypothetical protein
MAVTLLTIAFVGFARTYYLSAFTAAPRLPLLIHLHAVVFTVWMLLFVAQTALVATNRTRLHRQLGVYGAVLAVLVTVLGTAAALYAAKRGYLGPVPGFADPLEFLGFSLGHMLVFAVLVMTALVYRQQPATHKRLMLLAICGGLIIPPLGRLPFVSDTRPVLAIFIGLLLAGPIYDRLVHGRIHTVYKVVVPLIVLSLPVRLALVSTPAWHRVAGSLLQLF